MTDYDDNPYYRWWYSIEKSGLPMHTITEYYTKSDPSSLFSVVFDGEEFTYPLLTQDSWRWTTFDGAESFVFNDEVRQTDYEWYYITSSISRMAYAANAVSVDTIEEIEEYVWNGELYTVNMFSEDKDEVEVILSDFYSVLSSSEPFIAEVNSFLYNNNLSQATDRKKLRRLVTETEFPIRDEKANTLEDIIENSSQTEFPIGGTHPIILKTETGYECLVSRRSTEVQSWPEYWTVVPAGYFSPDGIDKRLGVLNQFYSEYCEELFNETEGSVTGNTRKIREAEFNQAEGNSEYVVTGLGVEGVSLSFEVSGLYIVYDESVSREMKQDMDFNYEVDGVEFLDLDDVDEVRDFLTPNDVTPPSAFAFVNALQYLKNNLPLDEQPESVRLIDE